MDRTSEIRRRNWADLVGITAGVMSIGFSLWGAPLFHDEANIEARATGGWAVFLAAGVLSVLGVVLAQRSARLGGVLVALAGAALLLGPFALGRSTGIAIPIMIVLGVAMLIASRFVGPIPRTIPPAP